MPKLTSKEVKTKVDDLLAEMESIGNRDLVADIVNTALRIATDDGDRLDLKITATALREMRAAFRAFAPYRHRRKVTMFGSARTLPDSPLYVQARAMASALSDADWMVVTGAGPGIMAAGMEGAGQANSFGVNIRLPFEQGANAFIAKDPKLVEMKYFFTRKLMLIKESHGYVVLPGGFGTLDEAFELLTLIQTGKSDMHPVVLLDAPGGSYWTDFVAFLERDLVARGYASEPDLHLFTVTDDVQEAASELATFYANYDSMRFVGRNLILRLHHVPDPQSLADLNERYADIIRSGEMSVIDPQPSEVRDEDALDKARVAFHFDRMSFGRLRQLIDELNQLPSPPAAPDGEAASS